VKARPRRVVLQRAVALAAALFGASPGWVLQAQVVEPWVYEVEGVRVVQSFDPDRELVAVRLYLLGGARQLTPETAGIERMVLRSSERGTESFPGNTVRDAQVETGSRFLVTSGPIQNPGQKYACRQSVRFDCDGLTQERLGLVVHLPHIEVPACRRQPSRKLRPFPCGQQEDTVGLRAPA